MEFYKKIKQKIEDELNQDEDEEEEAEEPPNTDFSEGENRNENKLLRKEVSTLKEHINRNYDVYVKRLEKRKAKIKELEDNIKIILTENESLAVKAKESDGK